MKTKKYIIAFVSAIILVSLAVVSAFAASGYSPNKYLISITIPTTARSRHTVHKMNTRPTATARIWYTEFGVAYTKAVSGHTELGRWYANGIIVMATFIGLLLLRMVQSLLKLGKIVKYAAIYCSLSPIKIINQ